ncbi:putative tetratricopeptide-like helical domain superfamily [Helianthus annuus]|nr:putative tetratricopeptide-like helical domain superfamily [Helianthus annuus]
METLISGGRFFMRMRSVGFEFDMFSLSSVMGVVFDVNEGEQIHGCFVKRGWISGCSMHLSNALMVISGRCEYKFNAVMVFHEMPDWDVMSWTWQIVVALECVEAFEIHAIIWKDGCLVVISVCNALISMYATSGRMHDTRQVFDEMVHKDPLSWNTLINGYSQHHLSKQAIKFVHWNAKIFLSCL